MCNSQERRSAAPREQSVEWTRQAEENTKEGITVVVPTYNCCDLLSLTLESLCDQEISTGLYEVVVVDDGSTDNTKNVARSFQSRLSMTYHFQEDSGFRAAAARNVGIRHASFGVTLFIDAGILVSSKVLAMHLSAHRDCRSLALLGLSYGVTEYQASHPELIRTLARGPVDATIERMKGHPQLKDCRAGYMERIGFDLSSIADPWLIFWSGHVSVSTQLLRSVGGFDEWFVTWGGEDVELGLRLHQAGCVFRMLPGIKSIHYPHEKDPESKRASSRENVKYIYEKHRHATVKRLLDQGWEEIFDSR